MRGADAAPMVTRRTAADEVYRALRRDVITLRHRPGVSLTEQELARVYGTSRVPVREACRRLQQEGLLTAIPYKGYFVSQVSVKDIRDCYDLRAVLEVHALELAIGRASDADIDRLGTLATTEYTLHDWSSYDEFLEQNSGFHLALAKLSGNQRLAASLRDLLGTMQRFFFLGLDLDDFAAEMRREHEELVQLMRERATAVAVKCLRQQIERSRERILRALDDQQIDIPIE